MNLHTLLAPLGLLFVVSLAQADDKSSKPAEPVKAGPAVSITAAASASQVADGTPDDKDRMICKNERPVGSLIPTRVCRTAAQRAAERDDARKLMQDTQQRTGSSPGR